MNRYYNIYFDNLKTQARLRYKIEDTPVSRLWLDHVQRHIDLGYAIPPDVQWHYGLSSQEKIHLHWQELQRICLSINDQQLLDQLLFLDDYANCIDPTSALNQLHFLFHHTKETNNRHNRSSLLMMFNIEIHRLENLLLNQNSTSNIVQSCFYLENNSIPNIDIGNHLDLVNYWDHSPTNGDLVLGYHTIGKNLYHCWTNNDVDLVKKQMIRPQDNISTEVILTFSTHKVTAQSEHIASQKTAMKNWMNVNGLDRLVDHNNLWNMVVGYPKLGENVDDLTFDDACSIMEIGNISRIELE